MSCCIGAYDSEEVEVLQETDPLVDDTAYCECSWFGRKVSIDCIQCQVLSIVGVIGAVVGFGIIGGAGYFIRKLLLSSDASPLAALKFTSAGAACVIGAAVVGGTIYLIATQKKRCIRVSKVTVASDGITDDQL